MPRLEELVGSELLDSIRIHPSPVDQEELPLGASRMGGVPDLPGGFAWPTWNSKPLSFLAQFSMRETSALDRPGLLPARGTLWFFCDIEEGIWGDADKRGAWAVLHDERGTSELRRSTYPDDLAEEGRFTPCAVIFTEETCLPPRATDWSRILEGEPELSEAEAECFAELAERFCTSDGVPAHRMLGHPDLIQDDARLGCHMRSRGMCEGLPAGKGQQEQSLRREALEWRLLLQVDSDESLGTMWGDCGRLFFFIRGELLADRKFDETWTDVQCY